VAARGSLGIVVLCCLVAAGCGDDPAPEVEVAAPESLTVTSTAFEDGEPIPGQFTCDGDQTSPPLAWSAGSDDPQAWALVVDDPDAPDGPFVHWVVVDIPAATRSIDEGTTPDGAAEALNSAGDTGWTGPCPPSGTHHYRFTVYGLSDPTGLDDGASIDDALDAVQDAAVEQGTLIGTYSSD
jgi:Raf kinase inhibitor-like YbhB/YbcL family protein